MYLTREEKIEKIQNQMQSNFDCYMRNLLLKTKEEIIQEAAEIVAKREVNEIGYWAIKRYDEEVLDVLLEEEDVLDTLYDFLCTYCIDIFNSDEDYLYDCFFTIGEAIKRVERKEFY